MTGAHTFARHLILFFREVDHTARQVRIRFPPAPPCRPRYPDRGRSRAVDVIVSLIVLYTIGACGVRIWRRNQSYTTAVIPRYATDPQQTLAPCLPWHPVFRHRLPDNPCDGGRQVQPDAHPGIPGITGYRHMRAELVHLHHTRNPVRIRPQYAHDKSKICSTGFHFPLALHLSSRAG